MKNVLIYNNNICLSINVVRNICFDNFYRDEGPAKAKESRAYKSHWVQVNWKEKSVS